MMYQSPIMVSWRDNIAESLRYASENNIMRFVCDQIITIDKNELLRALEYDRGQYEKGYKDGLREANKWIHVMERLPKESDGTVLVCMPDKFPFNEKEPYPGATHNCRVDMALHSEHSGNWYFRNGGLGGPSPIAWMPLPEPYEGDDDYDY